MPTAAVKVEPRRVIPVAGSPKVFPVRRVYCIGRNYADHAREMGGNPEREAPFFFMKPADAVLPVEEGSTTALPYPPGTQDFHHEVELVVALKSGGRDIAEKDALSHVYGLAVGLDMTRRDLQAQSKEKRQPWENGKAADFSGPCGALTRLAGKRALLKKSAISLSVNGKPRQNSALTAMIWSIPEQIAILSRFYELKAGDLIFTGTPAGVASVQRGDVLEAAVDGPAGALVPIKLKVV
jgi:fumarylpyruvate hydrolase